MEINGREWSNEAVQSLYLRLGDFTSLALRLGESPAKLRPKIKEAGILPPTEYVINLARSDPQKLKNIILREGGPAQAAAHFMVSTATMRKVLTETGFNWKTPKPIPGSHRYDLIRQYILEPDKLRDLIIQAGGYETAAKWLGISVSYLRRHLDDLKIQHRHIPPDPTDAAKAMEEFGSVEWAAYHLGTTPNEFKKALEDWRDHRDPLKTGNNSVSTGRTGENYYFQLRKNFIPDGESALTNHSQKGFDFEDTEFGKVNVKTARPVRLSGKKGYVWSWGLDMGLETDNFALVALDESRSPIGLFMVSNRQPTNPPDGLNWKCWKNGTCGFYYRSKQSNPSIGTPPGFN